MGIRTTVCFLIRSISSTRVSWSATDGDEIREPYKHLPWSCDTFHHDDSPGGRATFPIPIVLVSCKTNQVVKPFFP
jgi:hypothetical protein